MSEPPKTQNTAHALKKVWIAAHIQYTDDMPRAKLLDGGLLNYEGESFYKKEILNGLGNKCFHGTFMYNKHGT